MAFDSTCQIRRALIMSNGLAQIDLKSDDNTSFDWNWFVSSPANAQQVLAVGLTAIATNKHVYATITDPIKPFAQLANFGLVK
jgi:hypothetical protein